MNRFKIGLILSLIIPLITTLVYFTNVRGCRMPPAYAQLAFMKLKEIDKLVNTYHLHLKHLPSDLKELIGCKLPQECNCISEEDILDPWGNQFIIREVKDPITNMPNFELISLGEDGNVGGIGIEADIIFTH